MKAAAEQEISHKFSPMAMMAESQETELYKFLDNRTSKKKNAEFY